MLRPIIVTACVFVLTVATAPIGAPTIISDLGQAQRYVVLRGTVTGTINGSIQSLVGASVDLEDSNADLTHRIVASVVTDANGEYLISNPVPQLQEAPDVRAGTYQLFASYRGKRVAAGLVMIGAFSTKTIDIRMGPIVRSGGAPPPPPAVTFFATDREVVPNDTNLQTMFMNARIVAPCAPDPDCIMSYGMSEPTGPILGPAQTVPQGGPSRIDALLDFINSAFPSAQSLLIFVHGYNNDFFAPFQLGATWVSALDPRQPVIVYSWPSNHATLKYIDDETNNTWAQDHFRDFLVALLNSPKAPKTINILAHSMGNRLVAEALDYLGSTRLPTRNTIGQVIFAAPDIDSGTFFEMVPTMASVAVGLTMYGSTHDEALRLSRGLHGHCRAGLVGCDYDVPSISNFNAIDTSIFYCDLLGHGYWAQSNTIRADVAAALERGVNSPQAIRPHLRPGPMPNSYVFFEVPPGDDSCAGQAIGS
jgi:hypothetical protein